MLYKLLKEGLIQTGVKVNNRDEAIAAAGQLMVNKGYVEPGYIEAMCEVAREMEGYIVITKGVAMPHARPDYVNKICSSLVLLDSPVEFGNAQNDPVKLVIALAATDSNSHMSLLQDIATVFGEDETVEELKKCNTAEELLQVIKEAS